MIDPKQRLLAGTVDYLAANGASEISLRRLAAALGTSHRMLIYHFGSKEGLLIEVVRVMEQRQREVFTELALDPSASPGEIARGFWRRLADPAMWPHERLFFEMYGRALQGDPCTAPLLDSLVESWLAPLTEWNRRQGMPVPTAQVNARLGVAVVRGLLLDLLATGDRQATDAAMEHLIAMYPAVR
ncbi:MAG TPA: TetR/AcrR family transcriptional regulator [Pseudonocardiaceae bacterium]|nr:TetR/AcrR family transcriptional regulator [Pseudonocardiaceae bacterium]